MYKSNEYLGLVITLNIFFNELLPAKGFERVTLTFLGVPQINIGIALALSSNGATTTINVKC